MKLLGSLTRLVAALFAKDGFNITFRPNQSTTYTADRDLQMPPGDADDVVVGAASTQTLTGKTLDADDNTISNLSDSNLSASAAIDASKIADGSVSNAEYQYLAGVSSAIQDQLDAKQETSEKGQANGYASLDGGGKIPASQLPSSVMEYLGTWDASTNTPTLADGTGSAGDVYLASVAGTTDFGAGPITFAVGDWAVYSGTVWQKSINSNAVVSVNGATMDPEATKKNF